MLVEVLIDGEDAEKLLAEVRDRLDMRSGVGQVMRDALIDHIEETYETGNRGEWASLDPATTKAKGSRRILIDTGNLLKNLRDPKVSGTAVVASSGSAFYAKFLKEGARGMPKRDPAPEPDHGFVADLTEALTAYLAEGRRS